jgi:hypothetical protein
MSISFLQLACAPSGLAHGRGHCVARLCTTSGRREFSFFIISFGLSGSLKRKYPFVCFLFVELLM